MTESWRTRGVVTQVAMHGSSSTASSCLALRSEVQRAVAGKPRAVKRTIAAVRPAPMSARRGKPARAADNRRAAASSVFRSIPLRVPEAATTPVVSAERQSHRWAPPIARRPSSFRVAVEPPALPNACVIPKLRSLPRLASRRRSSNASCSRRCARVASATRAPLPTPAAVLVGGSVTRTSRPSAVSAWW
jgi:hypothetical protein